MFKGHLKVKRANNLERTATDKKDRIKIKNKHRKDLIFS